MNAVINRTNKIYTSVLDGVNAQDQKKLKKSRKWVNKLELEIDELRDHIFYLLKNLEDTSIQQSSFYIIIIGYLNDVTQCLENIASKSYKHVKNQHKKLTYNQIKDLQELNQDFDSLLREIALLFESKSFDNLQLIKSKNEAILLSVQEKIQTQIERTRSDESSPKNTSLYFNILLESKNLLGPLMDLVNEYDSNSK